MQRCRSFIFTVLLWYCALCFGHSAVFAQQFTPRMAQQALLPDGAADCSSLGLLFAADTDTGLVRTAANTIGFCTGGTLRASISASGLDLATVLALAEGGTGAALTASVGGIFYSTATAGAILAGTATANQLLMSGASAAPAWSTAIYPATTTVSQLLYSSATNTVAGLATGNNGVLITSGAGVPSISSTIPSATQDNITRLGTLTTNLIFTDNTYDIGASGATRPRNLFLSGDATIGDQLIVSGVGPHVIGGATNANIGLDIKGTFTSTDATAYGTVFEQSVNSGADSGSLIGTYVLPTLVERGAGIHPAIVGLDVNPTVTNGAATATDFFGIRVQATAVGAGTTTATGLSVAAPTGATNNYAAVFTGGNVGIGTTAPDAKLDINAGAMFFSAAIGTPHAGPSLQLNSGNELQINTGSSGIQINNQANSVNLVKITNTGNVGIGTTLPSTLLHVGLAGTTLGTIGIAGNTSGLVTLSVAAAAGTWTMKLPTAVGTAGFQLTDAAGDGVTSWAGAASRREWKDILREWTNPQDALTTILATRVYDFRYRQDSPNTGDLETVYTGVMADEAPWAMHYHGNVVNPVNSLGFSILAIQALQAQITTQGHEIMMLKARLN